jgi:Protein of unknown function (DUF707)
MGRNLIFRNHEEAVISGPVTKTRELLYFIRCGKRKPESFDTIYSQSRSSIVLSLYEEPEWPIPQDCIIVAGGLSKYHAFYKVRRRLDFKFVFLLDADIELPNFSEDRILSKLLAKDVNCVQYSLSDDSHASHAFLKRTGSLDFRRVNFVEVMAPIFTSRSVDAVLETFPESISTWGLDFAWSRIFAGNKMYVMDSETMTHRDRPDLLEGPFYQYLKSIGRDPRVEMAALKKHFGCKHLFIGNVPPLIGGFLYGRARGELERLKVAL